MEGERFTHPSYGMLGFSRTTSSSSKPLFGSDIKHRDTIYMRLRKGELNRMLNGDYFFGSDEIVEVEMSYTQFAEAITSMNRGSGVPVTIRYIQGEGQIEECPFISKKNQFEQEFQEKLAKANEKSNDLIRTITERFKSKKSFTQKEQEEILLQLSLLNSEINGNSEFVFRQFMEATEKTTMDAKGEIEAFMQNKINSIAQLSLVEHRDKMQSLIEGCRVETEE